MSAFAPNLTAPHLSKSMGFAEGAFLNLMALNKQHKATKPPFLSNLTLRVKLRHPGSNSHFQLILDILSDSNHLHKNRLAFRGPFKSQNPTWVPCLVPSSRRNAAHWPLWCLSREKNIIKWPLLWPFHGRKYKRSISSAHWFISRKAPAWPTHTFRWATTFVGKARINKVYTLPAK